MSLFGELKRRNVFRVGAAYMVIAWLLIQVAETIFPLFGFDETPARIVVILLAIGFIPALIFAWVFELTPDGVKKEKDVDRSHSVTLQTGKKLDRMIMVILALALGYFAFDKFVLTPQREAALQEKVADQVEQARQEARTEALVQSYGDKSIAVLPFDDMSPEGDQEYLSDGIAEELLNLLAKIPDLRVISRSSAFSYKGKDVKLADVAEELNVAHILEGSVRKSGNRVRITAQLIEARSDTHVWSDTYDRTLDDVFAVQDEIAAEVVEQLQVRLLGDAPHVREVDPKAYDLFLQARHLRQQQTAERLAKAKQLLEETIEITPDYAPAWADLSLLKVNLVELGVLEYYEGMAQAEAAARTALNLDPMLASAHARMGSIARKQGNLKDAARYYQRALELDGRDLSVISAAAALLRDLRRLDQAIALQQHLVERDPVNPVAYYNLGVALLLSRQMPEAKAAILTTLTLSPRFAGAHWVLGQILLYEGDAAEALTVFEQESDEAWRIKGRAIAQYALGNQSDSNTELDKFIENWGDQWPTEVSHIYSYRGELDAAFDWLNTANASGIWASDVQDPLFDHLRQDPRWNSLMRRVGVAPEELAEIRFDVALPQ